MGGKRLVGTKHECRGRERDQIRYFSAGAGQNLAGVGLKNPTQVSSSYCIAPDNGFQAPKTQMLRCYINKLLQNNNLQYAILVICIFYIVY
uniref:Uncharacterized protein n=1 Tax=Sinocyclocheilus rhinocerous TaxID=307959 RepID=A0A673HZ65_9TELE